MGIAGCTKSHLSVLKLAKERGYKNVLILEDDFTFLISKEELEEALTDFFNLNLNYDLCMLAFDHQKDPVIINNEISIVKRIIETQSASAYIVNENYYDDLINLYEWALPLLLETGHHWIYANDQAWKPLQKKDNWLCFSKRLGRQRASFSDNAQCFMDYGK
jgi:glycosyl transferase family 25